MADNRFLIVIGLDIEDYTKKSISKQHTSQKHLETWVIDGSENAKIASDPNEIIWIDSGDGGYLIFHTSYGKAVPFLESFYTQQQEYNSDAKEALAINVRAAVHCSDALYWKGKLGEKYAGNAINVCARILNGMSRSYRNQVVCSGDYVRKLCGNEAIVDPLRLPDYKDKHGALHEIWNIRKMPGFGVKPVEEDLHEDPNEWRL